MEKMILMIAGAGLFVAGLLTDKTNSDKTETPNPSKAKAVPDEDKQSTIRDDRNSGDSDGGVSESTPEAVDHLKTED